MSKEKTKEALDNLRKHGIEMGWIKECPTCDTLKESQPTPDRDEVCPNCGDMEMMDYEPVDEERQIKLDQIPF